MGGFLNPDPERTAKVDAGTPEINRVHTTSYYY